MKANGQKSTELGHSLLGLKDLSKDQIQLILEQSAHFKDIITLFYELSTRTSSVCKGETPIDTEANLVEMGVNGINILLGVSGAPHLVAGEKRKNNF